MFKERKKDRGVKMALPGGRPLLGRATFYSL